MPIYILYVKLSGSGASHQVDWNAILASFKNRVRVIQQTKTKITIEAEESVMNEISASHPEFEVTKRKMYRPT